MMAPWTLEKQLKEMPVRRVAICCSLFALVGAVLLAGPFPVFAQTSRPDIVLSWRAQTYVPPFFSGKALPVGGSTVVVSVDAIQGGKFLDLSSQQLEWYVNEEPFHAGRGLRQISVGMPNILGSPTVAVNVRLPDYGDGFLGKTVEIPVSSPKVVLQHSYPKNQISSSFAVRAVPYFFTVASPLDLSYAWTVSGAAPAGQENPRTLSVQVPGEALSGSTVPVFLVARNASAPSESAFGGVTFVKK